RLHARCSPPDDTRECLENRHTPAARQRPTRLPVATATGIAHADGVNRRRTHDRLRACLKPPPRCVPGSVRARLPTRRQVPPCAHLTWRAMHSVLGPTACAVAPAR